MALLFAMISGGPCRKLPGGVRSVESTALTIRRPRSVTW
jgi:hypothetical protein